MLHDPQIRELLFDYLEERYGKIRLFEEKVIRDSRADVIAVTDGVITGYEIKSDFDSYLRLEGQVRDYDKFCHYNYVVVGRTHRTASEHIPGYWGILAVDETEVDPVLVLVREAEPNPKYKIKNQVSLLWKSEMRKIFAARKGPKYADKSRSFIASRLVEKVPEAELRRAVTDQLFERDYTLSLFSNEK